MAWPPAFTLTGCGSSSCVRRQHRWAEEEQPAPVYSDKRRANYAYRAFALVRARGTGKNTGVKREKGGPFEGPTEEAVIAARDKWVDDWLHAPPKRSKQDANAGTSTSAAPRESLPRMAAPRLSRRSFSPQAGSAASLARAAAT